MFALRTLCRGPRPLAISSSASSAARSLRAPRPAVRFQSNSANSTQAQWEAAARRNRTANLWLSGAVVAGSFALGFVVCQTLYNSKKEPPTFLLPSNLGIELQERTQPTYGSVADYHKCIDEIRELYKKKGKEDSVSTDADDLRSHGISDWSYHEAELPTVVVWVDSTEEVQDLVHISRKYRVPITPFSGGTSLEGHFSSVSSAAARCARALWGVPRSDCVLSALVGGHGVTQCPCVSHMVKR